MVGVPFRQVTIFLKCGQKAIKPDTVLAKASRQGITRKELGERLTLESHRLDSLRAAFVAVGLLSVSQENGEWVYRTAWGA